jgi:hypothetical protein
MRTQRLSSGLAEVPMSEIQKQIERRQQRALEEIVRVTNRGRHPLFSPFDVVSISGRTYRVTIRSLD